MALSDIFAAFRSGTPSQTQTPTPAAPPLQTSAPAAPVTNPNPVKEPAPTQLPQSPLDPLKDFWQAPAPVEGAKTQETPSVFAVTQQQIMDAAKKADFTKSIPREELAKVAAGGEEAVTALANIINATSQAAYGQAAFAATKIMERGLTEARKSYDDRIPELVKQLSLKDSLRTENPLFTNPAVAPLMEMVQNQLQVKFPNATATELRDKAKEYMSSVATAFAPQAPASASKQTDATDWTKFLE